MIRHTNALALVALLAATPGAAPRPPLQNGTPEYPGILRATFTGHTGRVSCVAVSRDGKLVASGGADNTARLWDTTTGKAGHVLKHVTDVRCLTISANGKRLAAGSGDTVVVWDVGSGEKVATFQGGGAGVVSQVAFSADGKTLGAAGRGLGKVWDVDTGRGQLTSASGFGRFAMTPDGKTLATTQADGAVQIWDVAAAEVRATLRGHKGSVSALAFSPDGKTLATGGFAGGLKGDGPDKSIKLWDVAQGKERATLNGHRKGIYLLLFAPDGKALLATDYNGSMKLWDPDKARVRAALEQVKIGERLQGTPVGHWAVAQDLRTWVVGAGQEVRWYDIAEMTGAAR
jgi:WD40 repeat protein